MKKAEIISSKHVDHIENEKRILEKIQHPFVVSIFITLIVSNFKFIQKLDYYGFLQDERYIYFVTEILRGGDLFTYHRSIGNFTLS